MSSQFFLRIGPTFCHRSINHRKLNLACCMYSSNKKGIIEKYEKLIDNIKLSSEPKSDKVRLTKFGLVRLDIDNELENSVADRDEISCLDEAYSEAGIDICNEFEYEIDKDISKSPLHSDCFVNQDMDSLIDQFSNISSNLNMNVQIDSIPERGISNTEPFYNSEKPFIPGEDKNDMPLLGTLEENSSNITIKDDMYSFVDAIKDSSPNVEDILKSLNLKDNSLARNGSKNNNAKAPKLSKWTEREIDKSMNHKKERSMIKHLIGNSMQEQNVVEEERLEPSECVNVLEDKLSNLQNLYKVKTERSEKYKEFKQRQLSDIIEGKSSNLEINENPAQSIHSQKKTEEKVLKTAHDVAKAMREHTSATASTEKYKQIVNRIPNYFLKTRYDIIRILKDSVVFYNDNLVGISKPYGMDMHDGAQGKRYKPNLVDFLPDLAIKLKCNKLFPVHRLDSSTTGVVLLARTPQYAAILKDKFKKGEIEKTYICITKGVPKPEAGIVNLFIGERKCEDRIKMDVRPDIPGFRPRHGKDKKAITKYEVISANSNESSAVVELKPLTGVTHQIRVHLGMALQCPILGDHKYSYRDKFAPQKLDNNTLKMLDIKQSRVRDLPMFLHASSVLIPDVDELNSVRVSAKSPEFFRACLKMLKLHKSIHRTRDRAMELVVEN